jgi:hypothetical protein
VLAKQLEVPLAAGAGVEEGHREDGPLADLAHLVSHVASSHQAGAEQHDDDEQDDDDEALDGDAHR